MRKNREQYPRPFWTTSCRIPRSLRDASRASRWCRWLRPRQCTVDGQTVTLPLTDRLRFDDGDALVEAALHLRGAIPPRATARASSGVADGVPWFVHPLFYCP